MQHFTSSISAGTVFQGSSPMFASSAHSQPISTGSSITCIMMKCAVTCESPVCASQILSILFVMWFSWLLFNLV